MSEDRADDRKKSLSQPLKAAPMPAYDYQRSSDARASTSEVNDKKDVERKLDLSGVVLNLN